MWVRNVKSGGSFKSWSKLGGNGKETQVGALKIVELYDLSKTKKLCLIKTIINIWTIQIIGNNNILLTYIESSKLKIKSNSYFDYNLLLNFQNILIFYTDCTVVFLYEYYLWNKIYKNIYTVGYFGDITDITKNKFITFKHWGIILYSLWKYECQNLNLETRACK